MYIARLNLSCDPVQHIGDRMENMVEITDTTLKTKISNIMGLAITDTWLDPESGTLLCSYADDEQMLFQFAEDSIFPLEVTLTREERFLLKRPTTVKIRIGGDWKEYPVTLEAVTGNRQYINCEQLQRDWSLLLMEWVQTMYISYNYEFERPVIVGRYDVGGILASDLLFFA